jgi:hypothetical protein
MTATIWMAVFFMTLLYQTPFLAHPFERKDQELQDLLLKTDDLKLLEVKVT